MPMVISIPIVAEPGCGHCEPHELGPACVSDAPADAGSPHLEGPAADLDRVMQALRLDLAARGVSGTDGVIRSLVLTPGQAELRLHAPACHGGAGLIDLAFQCLRRELPNTDVFVLPVIPKITASGP